jgi:inner membrane protein
MSVLLLKRFRRFEGFSSPIVTSGMIGADFPDVDLLYTYLIDHQRIHHHKYLSHYPVLWLGLVALSALWLWRMPQQRAAILALVFSLGGAIHVLLDGFIGKIWWLAPIVDRPYSLLHVPSLYHPWWWNYLFHWSFSIECAICAWALWLYRERSTFSARRSSSIASCGMIDYDLVHELAGQDGYLRDFEQDRPFS